MIEFHWPWAFLLLPLPLLALRWLPPQRQFPNALRVPFYQRLRAAESQPSKRRRQRVPTIPLLIWLLLLFALSQPLWLGNDRPRPISGRDLMLLIDVSGSMRRMDFTLDGKAADRLSVVKRVAARFTHGRRGDRLGLILFGDKAYLRASPSHDHQAVIELIDEAEIALAGESTAIGDALGLAVKYLRRLDSASRVAVLLTDGANNEGRILPRQAARLARQEGIRVYTIGVGAPDVPAPNPYGPWSSEAAGRFEREVLRDMAGITGGHFFHALDSDGLQQAYDRLDLLEPALGADVQHYLAQPLYPWPLGLALTLSMLRTFRRWRS